MLDFIATRGPELIMTVLGFLLLAYLRRNRQDIDQAHEKLRDQHKALHAIELKLAQDYPTAQDLGTEIRGALEPIGVQLQAGEDRMQRIELSLDRLGDRIDRVLDNYAGTHGGRG